MKARNHVTVFLIIFHVCAIYQYFTHMLLKVFSLSLSIIQMNCNIFMTVGVFMTMYIVSTFIRTFNFDNDCSQMHGKQFIYHY
jgi:hypothetical protein